MKIVSKSWATLSKLKIKKMVLELINELDYDLYKEFLPECSSLSEEEINNNLDTLIDIVRKYVKN